MTDIDAHLAGMDAAIDAHLRVDGWLRPAAAGADLPIRVALERPTDAQRMMDTAPVRGQAVAEVSLMLAPDMRANDLILIGAVAPFQGWKVMGQPTRPGDGRQWRAEVSPIGVVPA